MLDYRIQTYFLKKGYSYCQRCGRAVKEAKTSELTLDGFFKLKVCPRCSKKKVKVEIYAERGEYLC